MNGKRRLLIVSAMVALLCGCPFDLIHVEQTPARLDTTGAGRGPFELASEVNVTIGAGYRRVLKKGTRWRYVGRLAQGDVFTTSDQVLTVEASNIHEAYIVVQSRKLVGFYLPVERSFTSLPQNVDLPITDLP